MTTEIVVSNLQSDKHISAEYLSKVCQVSERQLRKLIEQIRNDNLVDGVVCSDESGYWISTDSDEINCFLRRYLGAAFAQIKTARNAKKFLSDIQKKEIQFELNFEN